MGAQQLPPGAGPLAAPPQVARPWLAFMVCSLATFMATLDASIVNVALPAIASQFGVDVSVAQWVVSAYLLVICMLLPLAGRLGDSFGAGRVFQAGMGIFVLGSVLCGLSPHIWALIGARVVQGAGATLMMAVAPAIIIVAFPGPERGRALGSTATVVAVGYLVGPAVGGVLLGWLGWPSIFFVNVPLGVVGLGLTRRYLPQCPSQAKDSMDLTGAALFAVAVAGLVAGLGGGNDWGWKSPYVAASLATAAAFMAAFCAHERHTPRPLVDFALLGSRLFSNSLTACALAYMASMFNTILLPFYLHGQLGLKPHEMGLLLAVAPTVTAVCAPLSGYASEKLNPAGLAFAGCCLTAVGMLAQASLGDTTPIWRVGAGQVMLGLGFGVFNSPNNNVIMSSAPLGKAGQVGAVQALARNLGMVAGVALATAVFEFVRDHALPGAGCAFCAGLRAAFFWAAALAGLGALLCLNGARMVGSHRAKP